MSLYRRDIRAVSGFFGKLFTKLIVLAAIATVVFVITQTPVLTNKIAMGQLENSNDWFVAMTMYQRFANVVGWIGNLVGIGILGWIGCDAYILAKTLKSEPTIETENEKEN